MDKSIDFFRRNCVWEKEEERKSVNVCDVMHVAFRNHLVIEIERENRFCCIP